MLFLDRITKSNRKFGLHFKIEAWSVEESIHNGPTSVKHNNQQNGPISAQEPSCPTVSVKDSIQNEPVEPDLLLPQESVEESKQNKVNKLEVQLYK